MRNVMNKMIYLIFYLWPTIVLANGETPVSDGLRYIINSLYGATGIAIATISVMIVGLLCLTHFCKWMTLGYTIVGICIIFGASSIVNGITSFIH